LKTSFFRLLFVFLCGVTKKTDMESLGGSKNLGRILQGDEKKRYRENDVVELAEQLDSEFVTGIMMESREEILIPLEAVSLVGIYSSFPKKVFLSDYQPTGSSTLFLDTPAPKGSEVLGK
jgi:hypothetical protein